MSFQKNYVVHLKQFDEMTFILYTTRGDIESIIKTNMINNLFASIEGTIAIGFGYGKNCERSGAKC